MRLLLPISLIAVLVAGCASSSTRADPPHAGTLQWGLVGLPDVPTLDPALASDPTSISLTGLIYGGLVRLDSRLRVRPDGAARWRISQHRRVYTFVLRPNLRFSDGRRVTAADFASSLQRSLGPEGSAGTASAYLGLIEGADRVVPGHQVRGISILNPETLRITLSRPAAYFLSELAFPASYVPAPYALAKYGAAWTDHAAGFGPYSVSVWRHSRFLILKRNAHYYGGLPRFRRIEVHFYGSASAATAAYQRGQLDLVSGLQPGATLGRQINGLQRVPALAMDYVALNTTRAPFSSLDMRRAFAASNLAGIASAAMGKTAFPTRSIVPPGLGITGPRLTTAVGSAFLSRTRAPASRPLLFVVPRDPQILHLAHDLARSWTRTLGIPINLRQLNFSNYSAVLDARAFDLALVRWGADYSDPEDFLATQLGPSPDNVTGWHPARFDALLQRANWASSSTSNRHSLFMKAAQLAANQVPLLPLDNPALTAAIAPGLQDVHLTALGTITGQWTRAGFRN